MNYGSFIWYLLFCLVFLYLFFFELIIYKTVLVLTSDDPHHMHHIFYNANVSPWKCHNPSLSTHKKVLKCKFILNRHVERGGPCPHLPMPIGPSFEVGQEKEITNVHDTCKTFCYLWYHPCNCTLISPSYLLKYWLQNVSVSAVPISDQPYYFPLISVSSITFLRCGELSG